MDCDSRLHMGKILFHSAKPKIDKEMNNMALRRHCRLDISQWHRSQVRYPVGEFFILSQFINMAKANCRNQKSSIVNQRRSQGERGNSLPNFPLLKFFNFPPIPPILPRLATSLIQITSQGGFRPNFISIYAIIKKLLYDYD